ncbi:hypothetical protein B0A48_02301 [Cryoendolithus antarcticus]|uniref:AB hydrolase-1 domain-containing protein n=1 Tax=Cryoendolithus antarcticus TaxID=1507870 RepID=A0A1V8TN87_9PEZI|nr:hypothetical protein B0A48_02301 [Cryoendolithus antarcticus]
MDLSNRIRPLFEDTRTIALFLGLTTTAYLVVATYRSATPKALSASIHRSPRSKISTLSQASQDAVPYPPNALPNPRDVSTPYGSIRTNLYGASNTGRKILLIHGISTPSVVFAPLATLLADKHNYQVLTFDLFGRGYSDSPDPETWRQDEGLWCSQIFAVLSSAGWLGERVAIVGYSLGGGIAASFTYFYPERVDSLVLITPSGVLRAHRIAWSSRLIYSPLLPQGLVEWLVTRRLRAGSKAAAKPNHAEEATTIKSVGTSEIPSHPALMADSKASPFPAGSGGSIAQTVTWQIDSHPGYIASFVSSIRHAPITAQHERWRTIGERQQGDEQGDALIEKKLLVVLGGEDGTIVPEETAEDATGAFGRENVRVEVVEGGHDVVVVNAEGCGKLIDEHLRA